MLGEIIKKEILESILSPKFVSTFILCTILILLSVYIGIENYRGEMQEYSAAIALNRKNLESQPTYNHLASFGTKINKLPQVLSIITTGIQPVIGRQATVNVAFDPELVESAHDSNPMTALFGEFDITMIVKIILSLIALLFTYDSISGEKERGTLRIILSNPLMRAKLIIGKLIGGFISLLVPLSVPLMLSLIMITVYPDISFSGEDWIRIGLIGVLFLLYLSVYFTLGFFISALTGRSSSSLFILLFIWVVSIFIIPKAAVMVTIKFHPIPSVHEITAEKDTVMREIQDNAQKEFQNMEQTRTANPTPEWRERYTQLSARLRDEIPEQINAKNAEIEQDFQAKRRHQQMLAFNLSRISPASVLTYGAMSLGKTGPDENERFLNSIKAYRLTFTRWINLKSASSGSDQKPEIGDMPLFMFKPMSLRDSLVQALPDFLLMVLMILALFAGAVVSFIRYDVR